MKKIIHLLSISLLFISCEIKVNAPSDAGSADKVRNGIELKEKGLKVEQAFLVFEDGKLVPTDNKVEVGQWVELRLLLDGWQEKDGKVFLDAEEKITTSEGNELLDQKSLFKNYPEGLNPGDAKVITLRARVTAIDKLYDYFTVSFRVWDKQNENEVSGSYKLHLK